MPRGPLASTCTPKDTRKEADTLSHEIIGAALEVHRTLGAGLLESAYEECLAQELTARRLSFERQKALPLTSKGIRLNCGYRLDLLVENLVILEIKAVEQVLPIHGAQLLTYLRIPGIWLGLLLNFSSPILRHGIRRRVN